MYARYDERTYCMPGMHMKKQRNEKHLGDEFHRFSRCQFTSLAKDSRHTWSFFGANIG